MEMKGRCYSAAGDERFPLDSADLRRWRLADGLRVRLRRRIGGLLHRNVQQRLPHAVQEQRRRAHEKHPPDRRRRRRPGRHGRLRWLCSTQVTMSQIAQTNSPQRRPPIRSRTRRQVSSAIATNLLTWTTTTTTATTKKKRKVLNGSGQIC